MARLLGLALAMVLISCGSASSTSDEEVRRLEQRVAELEAERSTGDEVTTTVSEGVRDRAEESSSDESQPEDEPETLAQVSTTTTTSLPTPEDLLSVARSEWPAHVDALGVDVVSSDVQLTGDVPHAATSTAGVGLPAASVLIWSFEDLWQLVAEVDVMDGGLTNVLGLSMVDLTNDGSSELFVQFAPNRSFGAVARLDRRTWRVEVIVEGPQLEGDQLSGAENLCEPSCADGNYIDYEVVWTGRSFEIRYAEPPATAPPATACSGYVEQAFEPYSLCTRGRGVQYLQEALIYFGYLDASPGAADGFFGPSTDGAVRAAQRDYGVLENGIAEGQWYRELIETYNLLR